jgi:hypothetical protein
VRNGPYSARNCSVESHAIQKISLCVIFTSEFLEQSGRRKASQGMAVYR